MSLTMSRIKSWRRKLIWNKYTLNAYVLVRRWKRGHFIVSVFSNCRDSRYYYFRCFYRGLGWWRPSKRKFLFRNPRRQKFQNENSVNIWFRRHNFFSNFWVNLFHISIIDSEVLYFKKRVKPFSCSAKWQVCWIRI